MGLELREVPRQGNGESKRFAASLPLGKFPVFAPAEPKKPRLGCARSTAFYNEQIRKSVYGQQLQRIVQPSEEEVQSPGEWDTSGESTNTVLPGLQHKYPQTALILATTECFAYCRFCFRKRMVGTSSDETALDYERIGEYIGKHPEINNILISGGDPFTLPSDQLDRLLDHLLPINHVDSIRIGTKGLLFQPQRFADRELRRLFERIIDHDKTAVIVMHTSHVGEINGQTETQVKELRNLGVQFLNQTVLLRNINDDPAILAATFQRLHRIGVRPYYLFQARPVRGGSHFQVPLKRAAEIVRQVQQRLNGNEKTFRYIMAHYTGKIEILGISEERLFMRYHQHKHMQHVGRIFSRPLTEEACWLDEMPED